MYGLFYILLNNFRDWNNMPKFYDKSYPLQTYERVGVTTLILEKPRF